MRELLRLVGLLLAALLCAYPLTLSTDQRVGMLVLLAAGACVNALVLWSDGALTTAVAALAGAYAGGLYIGDVVLDPLAPVFAAGLVVLVEVCDTALAVPALRPVDRGLLLALARSSARAMALAVVASVAVLGGSLVLTQSNGWLRVLAMAGAVSAVAVPVFLSHGETASEGARPRT